MPVPGLGLLSYTPPGDLAFDAPNGASPRLVKGARVRVPVGGRTVVGVVVNPRGFAPAGAVLKPVAAVLDADANA